MSYRRYWPEDRVARVDTMKQLAKPHGIKVTVTNKGTRMVQSFLIALYKGDQYIGSSCDIGVAEGLLAREIGCFDPSPARWLADNWDEAIQQPLVAVLRGRFGLGFTDATKVIAEARKLRGEHG